MDEKKAGKKSNNPAGTGSGPGYLETIGISLVVVLVTLFGYDKFYAQKIKTFDLQGFVHAQKELLLNGEITQKQFGKNLDGLEAKLQQILAENHNIIILLNDTVIKDENNSREIKIQ